MGENVTIKEYMELSEYRTADKDFDITNLDPDYIFIEDVERIRQKLRSTLKSPSIMILGIFLKPYAGDQVVLEVKPYEQENKNKQETPKTKRIEKRFFK